MKRTDDGGRFSPDELALVDHVDDEGVRRYRLTVDVSSPQLGELLACIARAADLLSLARSAELTHDELAADALRVARADLPRPPLTLVRARAVEPSDCPTCGDDGGWWDEASSRWRCLWCDPDEEGELG